MRTSVVAAIAVLALINGCSGQALAPITAQSLPSSASVSAAPGPAPVAVTAASTAPVSSSSSFLYLQEAPAATLALADPTKPGANHVVTLFSVAPFTIFFSDSPSRQAGQVNTTVWSTGDQAKKTVNATLVGTPQGTMGAQTSVNLALSNPVITNKNNQTTLTYNATMIRSGSSGITSYYATKAHPSALSVDKPVLALDNAALFIDGSNSTTSGSSSS